MQHLSVYMFDDPLLWFTLYVTCGARACTLVYAHSRMVRGEGVYVQARYSAPSSRRSELCSWGRLPSFWRVTTRECFGAA